MGHEIEAGCGMREILRAGYGTKIAWRDRDALISIGGTRDSFYIDSGMRDRTASDLLKIFQDGIGIEILKVVGWRDEAKTSGGMRDLKSLSCSLMLW